MTTGLLEKRLHPHVTMLMRENSVVLRFKGEFVVIPQNDDVTIQALKRWKSGGTEDEFQTAQEEIQSGSWSLLQPIYDQLVSRDFFEDVLQEHPLTEAETARWTRMLDFFAGLEQENGPSRYDYMKKLRQSTVLIVGVGGLGSHVTSQLLSLGVGRLILIDADRVEMSNLNRTAMYKPSDVGRYKVDCAVAYAEAFVPETKVDGIIQHITGTEDLLPYLEGVDLVIGCADHPMFKIRKWIVDACIQSGTPYLTATGGHVGPFGMPGTEHACPMCVLSEKVAKHPHFQYTMENQSRLPNITTGSFVCYPSIVAGIVGYEALRFLSGYEEPKTVGAVWEFARDLNFKVSPVAKYAGCTSCGR